jgi:hypothetical protein
MPKSYFTLGAFCFLLSAAQTFILMPDTLHYNTVASQVLVTFGSTQSVFSWPFPIRGKKPYTHSTQPLPPTSSTPSAHQPRSHPSSFSGPAYNSMIDSPTDFVVSARRRRAGIGLVSNGGAGGGNSLCTPNSGVLDSVYALGISVVTSNASAVVRGVCGIDIPRADGLGLRLLGDREGG